MGKLCYIFKFRLRKVIAGNIRQFWSYAVFSYTLVLKRCCIRYAPYLNNMKVNLSGKVAVVPSKIRLFLSS